MSRFAATVARRSAAMMRRLGESAVYTAPGGAPVPVMALIDRAVSVPDEYGVIAEYRCEIGLMVSDVGNAARGAVIDTGNPDDRWHLLEPIGNDGFETRWVATKA